MPSTELIRLYHKCGSGMTAVRFERPPMRRLVPVFAILVGCAPRPNNSAPAGSAPPDATVPLPGGAGGIGFDDIGWDASLDRVISPAGGTGNVDLVDPATLAVVADAPGGAIETATSGRGWLFAVDRGTRTIYVVDPATGAVAGTGTAFTPPDYARYAAATDELWVTEPDDQAIEVFALGTGAVPTPTSVARIPITGGPEGISIDDARGQAYVHLFGGTLEAIDLGTRTVSGSWPTGCGHSHGIPSIDAAHGFVFATCTTPEIHVVDVVNGRGALGSFAFADGGRALQAFSIVTGHAYLRADPGETVAALAVDSSGNLSLLGTMKASDHGHCLVADGHGAVWVCDASGGALLEFVDRF